MSVFSRSKGSLQWLIVACLLAVAMGIGVVALSQWSTTKDKYTAQANAEVLAQDIVTICESEGKLMVNNRDVCTKGEDVLKDPTAPIPGPKGEQGEKGDKGDPGIKGDKGDIGATGPKGDTGAPGKNGLNGKDGEDGLDSTFLGPTGPQGATGPKGDTGATGPQGETGATGPQGEPGTTGPQGEPGPQGEKGDPPSSITYTDGPMAGYTCTANPPGSTTYTCTRGEPAPPSDPNPILP